MTARPLLHLAALSLSLFIGGDIRADEAAPTPVGLYGKLRDLVLPGSELEAKPLTQDAPVVVRVLAARPHGDAFRYDFDFYGLEPGDHDLAEFLRRKDGSATDDLPPVPLKFDGLLAPGRLIPNEPATAELPAVGGYKTTLIIAGVVWVAVLLLLIFARRKSAQAGGAADARPLTLADRLRPLVESARDGTLDKSGQAELERTLLAFWRRKLDLADESPATALAKLKHNEEAAPLIEQLERWLHRESAHDIKVDVRALLEPYAKSGQ